MAPPVDLDAGVAVVAQPSAQNVDTARLALAPGRGPLASILPSVVTAPSTWGYGVLGGHLLQIQRKLGFSSFGLGLAARQNWKTLLRNRLRLKFLSPHEPNTIA